MKSFVLDTGPLIHLFQINQINLLKQLPHPLYIPASVLSEINIGSEKEADIIKRWRNVNILNVSAKSIASITNIIDNTSLQPAEIDAIYLTHKFSPAILLTDDLAARNTANRLQIETHGSVGIIASAFKSRLLSLNEAEKALTSLFQKSNLFINYAIIENAILQLHQYHRK